jgi:hypothetical protein
MSLLRDLLRQCPNGHPMYKPGKECPSCVVAAAVQRNLDAIMSEAVRECVERGLLPKTARIQRNDRRRKPVGVR